jgi:hypothetical protein
MTVAVRKSLYEQATDGYSEGKEAQVSPFILAGLEFILLL